MVGLTLLLVTVSTELFSPAKTMTNKLLVAETFRLASVDGPDSEIYD